MTLSALTISATALAAIVVERGAGVAHHLPPAWALFSFAVAAFRDPPT